MTIDLMEDSLGNYRSKPLETLYSKDASLAFSRIRGLPVRALELYFKKHAVPVMVRRRECW